MCYLGPGIMSGHDLIQTKGHSKDKTGRAYILVRIDSYHIDDLSEIYDIISLTFALSYRKAIPFLS